MFKPGKIYSHKRMIDSAFRVMWIIDEKEDSVNLAIVWYNKNGMCLNIQDFVIVKKSEFSDWYEFERK